MKNEEIFEIIDKARNGANPEELIDMNKPAKEGEMSNEEVLSLVNDMTTCTICKKRITDGSMYICKDCQEKMKEEYKQTTIGKALEGTKADLFWLAIIGMMFCDTSN